MKQVCLLSLFDVGLVAVKKGKEFPGPGRDLRLLEDSRIEAARLRAELPPCRLSILHSGVIRPAYGCRNRSINLL